jgi:diaminopimelate epimerase
MRVLNADGSEAEMCGNGLRCVAKVLYESDPALRRPTLRIETGAGVLTCTLEVADGVVTNVTEEMGRPRLTRSEIPLAPGGETRALRETIRARDRDFRFTAVSMGNPHAVIFVDGDEDLRARAESYGPALEVADRFPRRTNVEFARVRGAEIDLVVWERGSGLTLACGTGACATVVAACLEERLTPGAETPVHLPGGTLSITVAPDYAGVRLRGPARIAFTGTLDLA